MRLRFIITYLFIITYHWLIARHQLCIIIIIINAVFIFPLMWMYYLSNKNNYVIDYCYTYDILTHP